MAEASVRVRFGDNKVSSELTDLRLQHDDCSCAEIRIYMTYMLQPAPKALLMEHEPSEVSLKQESW